MFPRGSARRGTTMHDTDRLVGAADPGQVAVMKAALDEAWQQVGHRFAGTAPEIIASARNAIADGILHSFRLGATDPLPLKHGGLTALRLRHPERFQTEANERPP